MKVRSALLIVAYLFTASLVCTAQERDNSDPPPTADEYPGSGSASSKEEHGGESRSRAGIFPDPPVLGERHIWQELQGYDIGAVIHRDGPSFSRLLADEIEAQIASGRRISRIVVTGFADGIPNGGLTLDLDEFPVRCQAGITTPVNDEELALLRGCIILDQVSTAMDDQYAGGISWKGDKEDERDGGNQGNPYRKVKIDIFMR
jgi:hypothetical protein